MDSLFFQITESKGYIYQLGIAMNRTNENLYYYGDQNLIKAIWDCRLKLNSPCNFNDPFEFLPAYKSLSERNSWLCYGVQQITALYLYCLCLSKSENNIRMWAQYGGNHSGLMIAFRRECKFLKILEEASLLIDVDYSHLARYNFNLESPTGKDYVELLRRKGSDWSGEKECRAAFTLDLLEKYKDLTEEILFQNIPTRFLIIEDDWISSITTGLHATKYVYNSLLRIKYIRNAKWKIRKVEISGSEFQFSVRDL